MRTQKCKSGRKNSAILKLKALYLVCKKQDMKRVTVFVISLICIICDVKGQIMFKPEVHGTIRSKYEYKTEDEEGRFEVRNARISITGNVID